MNYRRRDKTYPTFVKRTNEKEQTIEITEAFLDNYLPKLISRCQVLDLGVGEGDLSSKIASLMKGRCEDIRYEGIDISSRFVMNTRDKLLTIDIKDQNIIVGSCFGGDVDRLVTHPTLLMASQVLFYAPDISKFVEMIVKKMGLVAIIIGQSNLSFLNKMNKAYAASHKQKDTETKFDTAITKHDSLRNTKILYNSIIKFPHNVDIKKVAFARYEDLVDIEEQEGREILEFVAGSPLEYLEHTDKLQFFVEDIEMHLELNGRDIGFWNFMSILAPESQLDEEELMIQWKAIQKSKFSRDLNQFENAIKEGNIQIVQALFKQGLATCELHDDVEEQGYFRYVVKKLYTFIIHILSYPLRFYTGIFLNWPLVNKLELHTRTLNQLGSVGYTQTFHSSAIHKLQGYKYNAQNIDIKLSQIKEIQGSYTLTEFSYNEHNKNSNIIFYFFYLVLIAVPIYLNSDDADPADVNLDHISLRMTKCGASYALLHLYVMYQYFDSNNYIIHTIDSDSQILQFYLYERNNIQTINSQNFESQTPLHVAITSNDTEKAMNLLACKIIKTNIPDLFGKLPIHYAIEHNNFRIIKVLLARSKNVDERVFNPIKSFFDILFLIGKILFLDCSFTYYNSISLIKNLINYAIIGSIYAGSRAFGIRYPEGIYHHTELQKLNPVGEKRNFLFLRDDTYKGYSLDTLLHISTKFNHTEITEYLVGLKADVNLTNANGETPLHLAASNLNFDSVKLLINYGSPISQQYITKELATYFYYATALKIFKYIIFGELNIIIGEILFFKILHRDIFEPLHIFTSATPLHYACLGGNFQEKLRARFVEKKVNTTLEASEKKLQKEVVRYLIDQGADADLTFNYYINPENYIINIALNAKILMAGVALFTGQLYSLIIIFPLILIKWFLPYKILSLKPIDLLENENYILNNISKSDSENLIEYLHQYTTLNQYTDVAQMSFFGIQYWKYLFGVLSDQDTIQITEYGMYKGGSGKDKFIINKSNRHENKGYRIILKDYEKGEEIVLGAFYPNVDISSLSYRKTVITNKESTIIETEDGEEILALWNYVVEKDEVVKIWSFLKIGSELKIEIIAKSMTFDLELLNSLKRVKEWSHVASKGTYKDKKGVRTSSQSIDQSKELCKVIFAASSIALIASSALSYELKKAIYSMKIRELEKRRAVGLSKEKMGALEIIQMSDKGFNTLSFVNDKNKDTRTLAIGLRKRFEGATFFLKADKIVARIIVDSVHILELKLDSSLSYSRNIQIYSRDLNSQETIRLIARKLESITETTYKIGVLTNALSTIYMPTSKNILKLGLSTLFLCNAFKIKASILISIPTTLYQLYHQEYSEAINGAAFLAFSFAVAILAPTHSVIITSAALVYTGYYLIYDVTELIQGLIKPGVWTASKVAYLDLGSYLAYGLSYTPLQYLKDFSSLSSSLKLASEQILYKEYFEAKGEFGQKIYEYIYEPYINEKFMVSNTTQQHTLESKYIRILGQDYGYEVCRESESAKDISYYYCYNETQQVLVYVSISHGDLLGVIDYVFPN